jgi:hypothetical protein
VLPPYDDYVMFVGSLLFAFVGTWAAMCFGSLRRGRISMSEAIALVVCVAMAFGLASWI